MVKTTLLNKMINWNVKKNYNFTPTSLYYLLKEISTKLRKKLNAQLQHRPPLLLTLPNYLITATTINLDGICPPPTKHP